MTEHNLIDDREAYLADYAMRSRESAGREHPEPEHLYRINYQRDRDRILHSAAFRRLSGKTQVFNESMGDYHRTRLTHTMEVASIARTIGRSLRLNEDLIEALALLHDIGHPPFGHAGEDALNECLSDEDSFSHNRFALTIVRELERPYPCFPGLNLTREVLESQEVRADKTTGNSLLEAQVVDAADSMTYDAHDVDDAVKLGLLHIDQLRDLQLTRECLDRVTHRFGTLDDNMLRRALVHELIDLRVGDLLRTTNLSLKDAKFATAAEARVAVPTVLPSMNLRPQIEHLEEFLFESVYRHPTVVAGRTQSQARLQQLFRYYCQQPSRLPSEYHERREKKGIKRTVADYLAGMTDHYCLREFERLK